MQDPDLRDRAQCGGHGARFLGTYLDHYVRPHRAEPMLGRQPDAVPDDDAVSLQPLNPALHTGARPAHQSRELRGRSAAILLERQQQFLVNGIHGISSFYPCITSKYTLKMSEKTLSFAGGLNKNTRLISEAS